MNKTCTTWIISSLFLFLCIFVCASASQFILHKCFWWECAPQRNFRISSLELLANLFPEESIVNHVYPLSDEHATIEDGSQSIFWDNGSGGAGYTIYRYPTEKEAAEQFEWDKVHLFVNPETKEAWKPPANLVFSSSTANSVYVACGYRITKDCRMVERYQEYVVFFSASMDSKMTFSGFEKILTYIDKQISGKIYQ